MNVVVTDVDDNWIGKKLAIHEASHAVIIYLVFGHSCIKYVSVNASFTGAVHLEPFLCKSIFDLVRLPTAVAGYIGELIYASEHRRLAGLTMKPKKASKDDQKLIDEIMQDNELEKSYLRGVKKKVRTCLRLPFIQQAVLDLADSLYLKLYRTVPWRQKRMKGTLVQKYIIQSLARSATESGRSVNQMVRRARRIVRMIPIGGRTTARHLSWKPLTEDSSEDDA